MQFSIVHDFDVEPAGFWALFFSEAFENELFRGLKMRSWDVFERREEGDKLFRKVKLEPDMSVPSWASSVIKETGYTEIDVFHKNDSKMDVTIVPAMLRDRFHLSGVFAVTPLGPGRCRREFKGEIRVSVPLLGGKIEKFMLEQIRNGYEQAAVITRHQLSRK
jgi:hypothetical protein